MLMMLAIIKASNETGILSSLSKSRVGMLLDWSEGLLLAFGAILALGIFGEYAKADRWKAWRRVFEIMVTVGVAGELFADGGIFLFSRNLQMRSDAELIAMSKRLEQTNTDLTRARDDLRDALNVASDALRHDIASARTDARIFTSGVVDQITHRHLTAHQKEDLERRFSPYNVTPLQIEVVNPDEESEGLAKELRSVFPLARISKFSSRVRFKGMQVIELRGSNHFDASLAGTLDAAINEIFPDVAPRRRMEPDWGERTNVSGEFFDKPYPPAVIELVIGKRQ